MIGLIYPTNSFRVLKLMTGVLIVCLLAMAVPNNSFACHRNTADGVPKPHGPNDSCDSAGGGSGGNPPQVIGIHEHDGLDLRSAALWAPTDELSTCVMQKNSGKSLSGAFPRHIPCASLPSELNPVLGDDIIVIVHTSNRGVVLDIEVQGQDLIGTVGLVHVSDPMVPLEVETFEGGSMIIHVHADNVGLHKCDTHVLKKQSNCDTLVGEFAIHDLIYSPAP